MKKPISQYVTISIPKGTGKSLCPTAEQTDDAYRFFGLTPPPKQLEMDFDKLELYALSYYGETEKVQAGGKTVIIDKLLEGFAINRSAVPIRTLFPPAQFIGRATRKVPAQSIPKSKAQHKLDKLDYELKKIKANFEAEAGQAYRSFLAGIVHSRMLLGATTSPARQSNWYTALLHDLGYAPHQLNLPAPELN